MEEIHQFTSILGFLASEDTSSAALFTMKQNSGINSKHHVPFAFIATLQPADYIDIPNTHLIENIFENVTH